MKVEVLFITHDLKPYRIPIFNRISDDDSINLTIAHSGASSNYLNPCINEIKLDLKQLGSFKYFENKLSTLIPNFDVVVCTFYVMNLSFLKLALNPFRKYKMIFWGIGVRASYKHKFDAKTPVNYLRYLLAKESDAMIFYSDYARNKFMRRGFPPEKLFVMQNTVEVIEVPNKSSKKDKILFVGSLYKGKMVFELLYAFQEARLKMPSTPRLYIVGNGSEYKAIEKWIENTSNQDNIILHGSEFNEQILSELFQTSIACISPGQAGLTVLKSFGYGVPFITQEDAITGGERLNIVNGVNGLLYKEEEELVEIMVDLSLNPDKYTKMGQNAREFYFKKRTPEIMAQGFIDAIDYVVK
ncbi:glycosyltransferase family 4 protein [Robiginitalea aurantiaca]|uniref:Glycosyltransferase family 4 protein n=1 Tax=Robiginitalea aurantiaca TaxID=3056915 RepID=A0ABT7WIQ4_9FLAO|nr:glycosyltransferase family 4 protein [Robiginitalea aurantiaca]MDM9632797.1 glycosyltransferase family 4 protein [Robiginitalea aurantiaca]